MQQGRFFRSVLNKVVSPKKAGMESTSSSRKPSLQALSSLPLNKLPLILGYTVHIPSGDGIYLCERRWVLGSCQSMC